MNKSGMRIFLVGIAACAALSVFDSSAQNYPTKAVRLLVGFTAGSAPDVIARALAPGMGEILGQSIIVENRGGAGGLIATEQVAKAPADGYTLLMMAAADTLQPALRVKLSYDLERDFAPVSLVAMGMAALAVSPGLPVHNVKELIALAKSQPAGKMSFGSSGVGSSSHLMGELFNSMADVKITHVPYKGSADSAIATAAGQIEMSYPSVASVGPLMESGKIRVIAVTGPKRASALPSIPTISEAGLPGYERTTWFGVTAPAGVSKDIIARLNAAIVKVGASAEMKSMLNKQNLESENNTPEQFAALIHREIALNAKLIQAAGIKPE